MVSSRVSEAGCGWYWFCQVVKLSSSSPCLTPDRVAWPDQFSRTIDDAAALRAEAVLTTSSTWVIRSLGASVPNTIVSVSELPQQRSAIGAFLSWIRPPTNVGHPPTPSGRQITSPTFKVRIDTNGRQSTCWIIGELTSDLSAVSVKRPSSAEATTQITSRGVHRFHNVVTLLVAGSMSIVRDTRSPVFGSRTCSENPPAAGGPAGSPTNSAVAQTESLRDFPTDGALT